MRTRGKTVVLLVLIALVVSATGSQTSTALAQQRRFFGIATAAAGGGWHPVGLALGTLWTRELQNIGLTVSAQTSAGAPENIEMMRVGEIELALNYPVIAHAAWNGVQAYEGKPFRDFRTIATLFITRQHLVLRSDLIRTGHVTDIQGHRISIGPAGSGTYTSNKTILATFGLQIQEEYLGFGAAAEALRDGRIDGADLGGGLIPQPSLIDLMSSGINVTILNFTQEDIDAMNAELPVYFLAEIPPNTYPRQPKAHYTYAQPTFLTVREDIDEETVYLLTKTMWENIDTLREAATAFRDTSLEDAVVGLHIPLHTGAYRYYREQGLPIPDHLIPPELR